MKHRLCILVFILALVCCTAYAQNSSDGSLEAQFQSMTIEELQEADALLHKALNEKIIAGAKLQLNETDVRLATAKTLKLTVNCSGREITRKTKITYTTSDKDIATIAAGTGIITAKAAGTAVITVTAEFEDGGILTAECKVTVYVPVTSMTAQPATVTVLSGYTADLTSQIKIQPKNATEQGLLFRSEDTSIATVDENGIVTGKSGGKVKIIVTSAEQTDKPKTATVTVTVTQPVSEIRPDSNRINVGKGKTAKLTCKVLPSTATNQQVTWTSADPKTASVTANGTVTGVKGGKTILTCTAKDGSGVTAKVEVHVITAVSKVTVSPSAVTISEGGTTTLAADVLPKDATDRSVTWKSDDTGIATVDANGKVTGRNPGKVKITATAKDGSKVAGSVTVSVEPKNPVMVNQIHWQITFGIKNGKMGVVAENLCVNHTIKSFDYIVKCYNRYDSNPVVSRLSYKGPAIYPGKEGRSNLSTTSISGFTSAYYVEITPTYVYYTDGTSQAIASADQYTSTFDMR